MKYKKGQNTERGDETFSNISISWNKGLSLSRNSIH